MSNHKWQKLFLIICEFGDRIKDIEFRFTDTDLVWKSKVCFISGRVHQTGIDIFPNPGWVEYKHIEGIAIPRFHKMRPYDKAPVLATPQDIDGLLDALKEIGEFPVTKDSEYIRDITSDCGVLSI